MSNEVVTNTTSSVPALYSGAVDDFADMRQRDVQMPNLRLMQQMSPLVVSELAKSGDFASVSAKEIVIPRGSRKFVVPFIFWLEWIEWNPKKGVPKEEMIVSRSNDPSSALAKRAERYETFINAEGKERPVVTEYYNFIVAAVDGDETASDYSNMYVLNFSKTNHRTGKGWLNKLAKAKIRTPDGYVRAPIWYNQWELFASQEKKGENTYWVSQIGSSKPTPVDMHEEFKDTSDAMKQRRADIMAKNSNESEAHDKDAVEAERAESATSRPVEQPQF